MNNFIIRRANEYDTKSIIDISNKTWITTYKGLLSDKTLNDKITKTETRIKKLKNIIKDNNNYYVAIVDNKIIGFISYGKSRNKKYENYGEINALYVLKEYQKLGIGKKLFLKGIENLVNLGFKNMILNVLEGNNTINFYKHFNGEIIDQRYDYFSDELIKENIMLFKDINKLINKK